MTPNEQGCANARHSSVIGSRFLRMKAGKGKLPSLTSVPPAAGTASDLRGAHILSAADMDFRKLGAGILERVSAGDQLTAGNRHCELAWPQ